MFKDFKTEIKLLLVIALIAVVVAVGGILLLRGMMPAPQPSPSPQTLETADFTLSEVEGWQTYRSDEFGFELKHPSDWFIYDDRSFPCEYVLLSKKQLTDCYFADYVPADFYVFVLEEEYQLPSYTDPNEVFRSVIVDGEQGVINYATEKSPGPRGKDTKINVNHNDKGYSISFVNTDYRGSHDPIYDQILSTFRFVDSKDSLRLAEAQTPAAGACWDSGLSDIAALPLGVLPPDNVPVPRCLIVKANQKLQVINYGSETITVTLGRVQLTVDPEKTVTDDNVFGSYLAPGVHSMIVIPEGVVGVPRIWLKDEEIDRSTWRTYQNSDFGFEVDYPTGSFVKNVYEDGPYFNFTSFLVTYSDVSLKQESSLPTELPKGTITFNIDEDPVWLKGCLVSKASLKSTPDEKRTISGIDFSIYDESSSASGGSRSKVQSYRTVYDNKCYRIESSVRWQSIDFYLGATTGESANQEDIKEEEKLVQAQVSLNNQIFSTFRFVE